MGVDGNPQRRHPENEGGAMRVSQDESRSGVSRVAIRRIDHLGRRSNSLNPDDSSVDGIFLEMRQRRAVAAGASSCPEMLRGEFPGIQGMRHHIDTFK